MARVQTGVGQMTQTVAPQRPVKAGALHPIPSSTNGRKRPKTVRVFTLIAHNAIRCKTCKGLGCIGRCRF